MWGTIIGVVAGGVKDFFSYRKKKQEVRRELSLKKMEKRAEWEITQANQAGWKDDWFTILLSVPLVLSFTPFHYIITDGFKVLAAMPEWYLGFLFIAILASFGIRAKDAIQDVILGKFKK